MTNILTIISLVFFVNQSVAQQKPECQYAYFNGSKTVSTSVCWQMPERFSGRAIAYNKKGEIISEWQISRMHMLASVHFSYYPSGAVKRAEYSSHPDGGIQWYRSFTDFDENGVVTGVTNQSHEDLISPTVNPQPIKHMVYDPSPPVTAPPKDSVKHYIKPQPVKPEVLQEKLQKPNPQPKPFEQEVMACGAIFASELWLENRTKKKITVQWFQTNSIDGSGTVEIKPGERIKVTEYINIEQYNVPLPHFTLQILNHKGKPIDAYNITGPLVDESRLKENRKGFVYGFNLKK